MNASLSSFLLGLFENGEVTVKKELSEFSETEKQESVSILKNIYEQSKSEMPSGVPEFDADAALWGSMILYRCIQFVMIRNLEAEEIEKRITDFKSESTPSSVYSADLCLRYLPDVLRFAVSLAPDDPLVVRIKQLAEQWPFSSVGIKTNPETESSVSFDNRSLMKSYVDRIIDKKDLSKINNNNLKEEVEAVLGNYSKELWPGYLETKTTQ
ncbi:MAG: hypothetical protein K0S32_1839 [Bacteroidetes bacterium]|jgi:hypothetical protein|nr:hypothetical protein [Bacteroidota bacterium]